MMDFMKRMLCYLFIILFVISIYRDLTIEPPIIDETIRHQKEQKNIVNSENKRMAILVRIQPGDTILSITEQINANISHFDITQILNDFITINPNTDPYQLQSGNMYYFPLY